MKWFLTLWLTLPPNPYHNQFYIVGPIDQTVCETAMNQMNTESGGVIKAECSDLNHAPLLHGQSN